VGHSGRYHCLRMVLPQLRPEGQEEMLDSREISKASGENLVVKSIVAKNIDGRHESLCPSLKSAF